MHLTRHDGEFSKNTNNGETEITKNMFLRIENEILKMFKLYVAHISVVVLIDRSEKM